MRRQKSRNPSLLAIAVGMAFSCDALAQIATDGRLGPAGALAGPNYGITANLGKQVGTNLFHSFSTFNLTSAESATFSGPAGISNILNRVTGASASSIDGLIRSTIAGANLFLINPKGILFGPNASLDLTGSFHASTANYIKLADGGRFDATDPGASVLTTAPPAAFGFLGPTPAPITVQGSNLSVPEGSSLSLVGGAVNLADATLRTVAGDIRLVAMGGAGEVPLNASGTSLAGLALAPIMIERSTIATDSGARTAPGRIVIRGGQLTVLESNLTSTNNEQVDAPPVELAASGDLTVSASSITSQTGWSGRGADIALSGENVTVDHNSQVGSVTWGDGRGGDVALSARNAVRVLAAAEDPNYTNVYSWAFGAGAGGDIRLSGDAVTVQSGNVYSYTAGDGATGSIVLRGRDVAVTNGGYVATWSDWGTSGRTGDIDVVATQRFFTGGLDWFGKQFGKQAFVFTITLGSGNAGDIRVAAPVIDVIGGWIQSVTYDAGNAGTLRFDGDVVRVLGVNGASAQIESAAEKFTTGNGGGVEIRATRAFELSGVGYPPADWTLIAAITQGNGRGGDIVIESPSIVVDQATIFSRTIYGTGTAGDVTLRADEIRLRGELNAVSLETDGPGKGGSLSIRARSIDVGGNSAIVAFTSGPGDAGTITIDAQRLRLTGSSSIDTTSDGGGGNAGRIVLNISESFEMSERNAGQAVEWRGQPAIWRGGLISRSTGGGGNAGSVLLIAPEVILDDARILISTVESGQGGRAEIRADNLTLRNGAQIDAKSFAGATGNAGSILVDVGNRFEIAGNSPIDGAFSGVNAETNGAGRGGDVNIAAGTLVVDRGFIRSSTSATGDAGAIDIRARDVVLANGGWIDGGTSARSTGAGGSVNISATGSIVVRGIDRIPFNGVLGPPPEADRISGVTVGRAQGPFPSTISSNTAGAGAGGNVSLSAPQITVADSAQISANSSGTGTAGSIFIQAPEWLKLSGGSITTQALSSDGGNIDIRAGTMVRLSNSEISTTVGSGQGSGGNIFIDPTFVILENSRIAANAFGGAGGIINIISDFFFASPDSVVEASSQLGVSGSVQIAGLRTDAGQSLAQLPAAFLDASALLQPSCAGRAGPHASSFIGVGRGGLAAVPEGYSASRYFSDTRLPLAQAGDPATSDAPRVAAHSAPPLMLASACGR